MNKRKTIQQLKKLLRVEMTHMLRINDSTIAYYCMETDEIILFVDAAMQDCITHFDAWGKVEDKTLETFVAKFISRTVLHELYHWTGIENSYICEYLAVWHVWNKGVARTITDWMYPTAKAIEIPVVEIEDV